MYGSDNEISQQEMIVMIYNSLKVIGQLLKDKNLSFEIINFEGGFLNMRKKYLLKTNKIIYN